MIAAYEPAHREALARLMETVWGEPHDREELAWWYERPGIQTLLEWDGDRLVGAASMAFLPMLHGGEELTVGMPMRVATDPELRGRGIFGRLERESEARAEAAGVRLLLTVPNAASKPVFLERLGWTELPPLRVRVALAPGRRAPEVAELTPLPAREGGVVRDAAYLRWRFGGARRYRLLQDGGGYAVLGRRGRMAVVAATAGDPPGRAGALALPPTRGVPTPKTFALLGRSLGAPIPPAPIFELGDLDFL